VDDNGRLDEELLQRLKNQDLFQGACHELFAEATCYRAGFTVQHEDEKDRRTRHAEFTVRHVVTGQLLSVEEKSRHRQGVLRMPGTPEEKPQSRVTPLINDAVAKKPKYPLVVFVDTNLPFKWAERVLGRQAGNAISNPIQTLLDKVKKHHNDADPYCMTRRKIPVDSIPTPVRVEFLLRSSNVKKETLGISSGPICLSCRGMVAYGCCAPSKPPPAMWCVREF
jgi:hypothetical protein